MAIFETLKKKYTDLLNPIKQSLNDNQGWVRQGKLSIQPLMPTLKSVGGFLNRGMEANQAVGQGIINTPGYTKNVFQSVSTPEKQKQFQSKQVNNLGDYAKQYIGNRYVAPIAQVPYNAGQLFGKDKSLTERGLGALGLLGGTVAMVPDPIGDVALPAYDYLKGVKASQLRGEGTIQSYKTGLSSLSGQKQTGLGDAVSTNPTIQTALNFAELPIMLGVTGKVNKYKNTRDAILGSEKEIRQLSNSVKLSDQGVHTIDKHAIHYAEVFIDRFLPNLKKSSQLRAIKENDPRDWVRAVTPFIEDAFVKAKNPEINVGFNTRTIKRLDTQPIKTGGDVESLQRITGDKFEEIKKIILNSKDYETASNKITETLPSGKYLSGQELRDVNILLGRGTGQEQSIFNSLRNSFANESGINTGLLDTKNAVNSEIKGLRINNREPNKEIVKSQLSELQGKIDDINNRIFGKPEYMDESIVGKNEIKRIQSKAQQIIKNYQDELTNYQSAQEKIKSLSTQPIKTGGEGVNPLIQEASVYSSAKKYVNAKFNGWYNSLSYEDRSVIAYNEAKRLEKYKQLEQELTPVWEQSQKGKTRTTAPKVFSTAKQNEVLLNAGRALYGENAPVKVVRGSVWVGDEGKSLNQVVDALESQINQPKRFLQDPEIASKIERDKAILHELKMNTKGFGNYQQAFKSSQSFESTLPAESTKVNLQPTKNQDVQTTLKETQILSNQQRQEIQSSNPQPIIPLSPSKGVEVNVSPTIPTLKLSQQTKTSIPNKISETPTQSLVNAITGTKERKFVTTIKESIKTNPEVKNMVSGQYIPKANDTLSRAARAQIKADINVARDKALAGLDDESVAIANELIQHYSAIKDYDTAAFIANTAAENLTSHGRAIQAASLYDKLTPEGIQRYAATQLQKVKMQLKPEDAKRLTEMAKQVQKMPAGADKAMAQQQLMAEIQNLIPTATVQKLVTIWKAGLLTGLKTTGRNITGNTINNVSEIIKDIPATATDMIASLFTGQRTKTFTVKGVGSGTVEGVQKGSNLLKTGFDERKQMGKLDVNHITWGNNPIEQAAKKYTETVFRFLGAQDQPFYYASLKRSLNDQASAAAINAGKSGDKVFIQKLLDNPTEQMIKTAVHDAEVSVFQNNTALSSMINAAKRSIKEKSKVGGAMADFVAPFTGVPSSIVGQVVNYSPVGMVKTIVSNIGQGKFNQRDFAEGIGRGTVGTGVLTIGSALMANNMMTLDYPKDQKERAQWELEGKQPFSIKIDGKWRSIGSLGPQASVLFIGGYGQQGGAGQAFTGGLKQQKEQTFLQGIKNISDAIDDPTGKSQSYFKSVASSLIPTLLGDFAKGIDPLQRELNSPLDAMKGKIPVVRQSLLPQRNVFGEAKSNEGGFVGSMLDFTNATSAKDAPPIGELRRLSDENFPATPTKITKDQTIQKMKVSLTPEQLNAFEAKAGPIIKEKINQLIQNPMYASMSDEKKQKAIQDITNTVRTQVKNTMNLNDLSTGKYEVSDDAPKSALDTVKLYGTSLFKDPQGTISAITNGQPIRKNRGDAVVLERMQGLAAIDKGDTTTQVDHIIPLSLGGSNDSNNRQVISTQENQAKAVVEVYLGDLLSKGKINKKEAQDRVLNWRNEIDSMPSNYKNKANSILNSKPSVTTQKVDNTQLEKVGGSYQVIDSKGNVSDIDIAFPQAPKLTGLKELDKSLKSKYSGQLTTLKNNIVKLQVDGQLTPEEANAALTKINNLKVNSGNKKPKKVKLPKIKVVKIKVPKLKKPKQIKIKKPKKTVYKRPSIKKIASYV